MKEIKTRKGESVLVDDDVFSKLNAYTWHIGSNGYARRIIVGPKGKKKCIYLHHLVTGPIRRGYVRDHINRNKLDNQLKNIRITTQSKNVKNQRMRSFLKSSRYKGVCYSTRYGLWRAYITANYQRREIGWFKSEVDAAVAYDMWALLLHGEFASTNFKPEIAG